MRVGERREETLQWDFQGDRPSIPPSDEAGSCLTGPSSHPDRGSWPCGWAVGPVRRSRPS